MSEYMDERSVHDETIRVIRTVVCEEHAERCYLYLCSKVQKFVTKNGRLPDWDDEFIPMLKEAAMDYSAMYGDGRPRPQGIMDMLKGEG